MLLSYSHELIDSLMLLVPFGEVFLVNGSQPAATIKWLAVNGVKGDGHLVEKSGSVAIMMYHIPMGWVPSVPAIPSETSTMN